MKLKCLYIGVAYSAALELFYFELTELRDSYNRRRDEPLIEPYISPITGMIMWIRAYLIGIVPFMELFQVNKKYSLWHFPFHDYIISHYDTL